MRLDDSISQYMATLFKSSVQLENQEDSVMRSALYVLSTRKVVCNLFKCEMVKKGEELKYRQSGRSRRLFLLLVVGSCEKA